MPSTSKPFKSNTRKKFAVPPVKVACLDCRASRTRCDGKQNCSNCVIRGKACVYAQSRRGGSRIRKRESSLNIDGAEYERPSSGRKAKNSRHGSDQGRTPSLPETSTFDLFSSPMSLLTPGAGLKPPGMSFDDTELIFDYIFGDKLDKDDSGYGTSVDPSVKPEEAIGPVRVYRNDEDILNAYYFYIHPYFPILPPPDTDQVTDNPEIGSRTAADSIFSSSLAPDFEPSTPLSLAISATVALIPHPSDPDPSSAESTLLRREQAQAFAQSALESIEIETELIDSSTRPADALSNGPPIATRQRFHPQAPLENESILALLMLSTYEYAQRGNIAKMKTRAGQALSKAMDLGLHAKGHEDGKDAEANRRAWWMTYICVCQGSIFSNTSAIILLYDPRFTTAGPTFASDVEAWAIFLQAQQVIVAATEFVVDLENTLKLQSDPSELWDRMLELESIIEPLSSKADTWTLPSSPTAVVGWSEISVAYSLRGIARIKLNSARIKVHRYCAFSDIPIFTKKHCDLAAIPDELSKAGPNFIPVCPCSSTYHSTIQGILEPSSQAQSNSTFSQASSNDSYTILHTPAVANCGILPFSSHFSAKVCLRAAFNIARSFQSLPFPPLASIASSPPHHLGQMDISDVSQQPNMVESASKPPRMVPMFACCAMQSSYAMVMLSYKSHAMTHVGSNTGSVPYFRDVAKTNDMAGNGIGRNGNEVARVGPVKKLLRRLEEGLGMILDALCNYAIAYEALGGMRDQIEIAARSVGKMESAE